MLVKMHPKSAFLPGFAAVCAIALLAGCAGPPASVPRGEAGIAALGKSGAAPAGAGRILAADKLDVHVLYEPDLSREQLRVDSAGSIELPLVGHLKAAGLTPDELAEVIAGRLSAFLNKPQVDVSVISAAGEHVVVEGNVVDPGVYEIAGSASLIEVLARAKSPNRTAAISQIVVFREAGGQRLAAVFDLSRIRRGVDADPRLLPGDTVVVGFSAVKGAFRDLLTAAPALAIFRPY